MKQTRTSDIPPVNRNTLESSLRLPVQRAFKDLLGSVASSPINVFLNARKVIDLTSKNGMLSTLLVNAIHPNTTRTVVEYPPPKTTALYQVFRDQIHEEIHSHKTALELNGKHLSATQRTAICARDADTLDILGQHGTRPVPAVRYSESDDFGSPLEKKKKDVIIYLHGGAFIMGSPQWINYELFCANLLRSANLFISESGIGSPIEVISVEYALAPEAPFPAAVLDSLSVYQAIANRDDVDKIVLCGDSAGGNLAFSVALAVRNSPIKQPAHIVGLSPVTNIDPLGYALSQLGPIEVLLPPDAFGIAMQAYFGLADSTSLFSTTSISKLWSKITQSMQPESQHTHAEPADLAFGIPLRVPFNPIGYTGIPQEWYYRGLITSQYASPVAGAAALKHQSSLLVVGTEEMLVHDSLNMFVGMVDHSRIVPISSQTPQQIADTWLTPRLQRGTVLNNCLSFVPLSLAAVQALLKEPTSHHGSGNLKRASRRSLSHLFRLSHSNWDATRHKPMVLNDRSIDGHGDDIGLELVLANLQRKAITSSTASLDGDMSSKGWNSTQWALVRSFLEDYTMDLVHLTPSTRHLDSEQHTTNHRTGEYTQYTPGAAILTDWLRGAGITTLNSLSKKEQQQESTSTHHLMGDAPPSRLSTPLSTSLPPRRQPLIFSHPKSKHQLAVFPGMWHVFPLVLPMKESAVAQDLIARSIRHLNDQPSAD